jgi:septum formation protein
VSEQTRELVLASTSQRRHDLLRDAALDFRIEPPGIDEAARAGESPEGQARRLARAKARAVAERCAPSCCILAADTLVVLDELVLGKPRDPEEAAAMLLRLSGRTHRVITGWALLVPELERLESGTEESRVRMRRVGREEAVAYAASGEPLDKAGAYAVQGEGGRFVASIEGSRTNVIGLPLEALLPRLDRLGVAKRCRA